VHFDVPSALKLIWHELGHDILNLDHNFLSNNIMTSSMGTAYHCDQSQIKFNSYFSYYSQYPNLSWQKAVKDMFEGVNQYCLDCSNYFADGEDILQIVLENLNFEKKLVQIIADFYINN